MLVKAIKTRKVLAGEGDIYALLDEFLPRLKNGSVVAISSKVVGICEGRVVPLDKITKEEIIEQEAEYYLPSHQSVHGHHFTIARSNIVASAGADESNGNGFFVLWPEDPQKSANEIRKYLRQKYGLKKLGVILTDSVIRMLRRGTTGIALSHSGFAPLHNYIGKPDLFGRPFKVTWANIADGLAGAAVLVMGEGAEQTPIVVIEDLDSLEFQDRDPSSEELSDLQVNRSDDLFAPFLDKMDWKKGQKNQ